MIIDFNVRSVEEILDLLEQPLLIEYRIKEAEILITKKA